jgi:catechol 2,3-dioxygenase
MSHVMEATNQQTPVCFVPRRLGHVNLWAGDLKRSEAFYNSVCGLAIEFWEPDLKATFLGTGNTPHDLGMIETTGGEARYGRDGLLQIPAGVGPVVGLGHMAWELENEAELVNAYRKAVDAGVKPHMTVDHQVAHSVYLGDPDGNQVEYYCDTVKDWRNVLHGEMELITSAWTPGEEEPFTDTRYDENPESRVVAEAPVHPVRVTHATLVTPQLDRMEAFYRTLGGLRPVYRSDDSSVVCMRGSHDGYRHHLVLCAAPAGGQAAYHHVSFQLQDEAALEVAERELEARGIVPERRESTPSKRSLFLIDPDGLRSEYYFYRSGQYPELSQVKAADRPFLI